MIAQRLLDTAWLACHVWGQARYAFKPPEDIRRDQACRVRRIVAHACLHVPYYKETMARLGLRPEHFRCAEDLAQLPLLEREQLQRGPERFMSEVLDPGRCLRLRSSGSTGLPVTVCQDVRALFQSVACAERVRSIAAKLAGKRCGYRETVIIAPVSSVADTQRFLRAHSLVPTNVPARQQRLSVLDPPEKNAELIDAFRPDVLSTYGSYLALLFPYLREARRRWRLPRTICYGADGLSDSVRRLVQDDFGIHVLSAYQTIEADQIGFECERHAGLHLNIDVYPVRIVDAAGHALPPGETGEVVVSNLVNRGTVLLNYRLGDLASLLPEPCPCGRTLPLLSFPQGRCDDFIVLPSGRQMHSHIVNDLIRFETEIWRYRVIQESLTCFRINCVVTPTCEREGLRKRIACRFGRTFGRGVNVQVVFVDSIDRTAAGKHRTVVSRIPKAQRGPDANPRPLG